MLRQSNKAREKSKSDPNRKRRQTILVSWYDCSKTLKVLEKMLKLDKEYRQEWVGIDLPYKNGHAFNIPFQLRN